jgi:hypothetical protein
MIKGRSLPRFILSLLPARVVSADRLQEVLVHRVAMLAMSNPELETEWAIVNDDWGVITISDGRRLIGFEYVESESSVNRMERLKVYEETLDQGLTAVIIVPRELYLEVRERVRRALGDRAPEVLSYDCIGITALPRPS